MNTDTLFSTQQPDELRLRALGMLAEWEKKYQAQACYIQDLENALQIALAWRFGRKSEAFQGEQRSLAEEDVTADAADISRQLTASLPGPAKPPVVRPVRQPLPAELPRETHRLDLNTTGCPDCGQRMRFLRDEISERLEFVPGHFVVHKTVRPQYSCPDCDTVHAAALPAQLIEKGQPGPGLLAQVVIAKACDHLPLYRQQSQYRRLGVSLPVSTLADWFGGVGGALKPLVTAMRLDLLHESVLQADETPMMLLNPGKGKAQKGYLWAYVSAAGSEREIVVYDCQPGRGGHYAQAMLQGWQGTLVVDGYAGYHALFADGNIHEAGCWAHVRRKFFDQYRANKSLVAEEALNAIRELYKLERLIKNRPPEQKRRWRQRYARPHLKNFHNWLLRWQEKTAPNSGLRRAIDYTLKRWPSLLCYLNDGRVPADNNRTENAIRPVALGRKNWLFAGSVQAGQRMADILSLLETAKVNGLEPYTWLRDVLTRLPSWPASRLHELLPYSHNTFS